MRTARCTRTVRKCCFKVANNSEISCSSWTQNMCGIAASLPNALELVFHCLAPNLCKLQRAIRMIVQAKIRYIHIKMISNYMISIHRNCKYSDHPINQIRVWLLFVHLRIPDSIWVRAFYIQNISKCRCVQRSAHTRINEESHAIIALHVFCPPSCSPLAQKSHCDLLRVFSSESNKSSSFMRPKLDES